MDFLKARAEAEKESENFESWRKSSQLFEDRKKYESPIDETSRTVLQAAGFHRESDEMVYWYTRVHPLILNGQTPYDYLAEKRGGGVSFIVDYLSADPHSL